MSERGEDFGSSETLAATPHDGERAPAADAHVSDKWHVGQTLAGRYTLLEPLGRGGMSEVYLARHELLKKNVAVKVLRPDIAVTKLALSRFHREAVAAASVGNPHIVDITDYGFTDDGNAFIVMERLVGVDLRAALVRSGALPTGRCVAIIRQVLRGLAAAHAQGIIHRDLKAENVFLCQRDEGGEFVKLLDFGISKVTQPREEPGGELDAETPDYSLVRTSTGAVMGTPQYIAPEQAHGDRDVDHRVDIYSAGVMLYEMLTGELPFSGKSALDVVMKHVQEAPQPPRQRRPDLEIPADLDRIVLKAMAKAREERYVDAEQMLGALPEPTSLPGGFSSVTLPAAPTARRRGSSLLGVGMLLLALFALGAVGLFWVFPDDEPPALVGQPDPVKLAASTTRRRSPPATQPPVNRLASQATPEGDGGSSVSEQPIGVADAGSDAAMITVRLQVHPRAARVFEAGRLVGRGEIARTLARGSPALTFEVRAAGYQPLRVTLETDRSQLRRVSLVRRPAGARPSDGTDEPGAGGPPDLHGNPYIRGSKGQQDPARGPDPRGGQQ